MTIDHKILITGAGRGIGAAIAEILAGAGAQVAITSRSEDQLDAVRNRIIEEGGTAHVLPTDLAQLGKLPQLVENAAEALGGLDVVINNAGLFMEQSVADMDLEAWEHMMRINATAPYVITRAALPHLEASGQGRVVMIASTSATKGYLHQSAYCASKHALLGFARALAEEVKPKRVKVHTVCPGGVDTSLIKGTYLSDRMKDEPQLLPEDIAEAVLYLLRQPEHADIAELPIRRFVP